MDFEHLFADNLKKTSLDKSIVAGLLVMRWASDNINHKLLTSSLRS